MSNIFIETPFKSIENFKNLQDCIEMVIEKGHHTNIDPKSIL